MVESTIGFLWIQKLELSGNEVWIEDLSSFQDALKSSDDLRKSSALWSLADLCMESQWRKLKIDDILLAEIVEILEHAGPCARKNAVLFIGNYCCDCVENQLRCGRCHTLNWVYMQSTRFAGLNFFCVDLRDSLRQSCNCWSAQIFTIQKNHFPLQYLLRWLSIIWRVAARPLSGKVLLNFEELTGAWVSNTMDWYAG